MFHDHLIKLLKELSIEGITVSRDASSFTLMVDDVAVELKDTSPGLQLSASLGECPQEQEGSVFSKMLRGNFLGQATKQARLGLDESGKNALLLATIPTIRSYRDFRDAVEDFVNSVIFWKKEIKTP